MTRRPRVLFVHINPDNVSFVRKDIDILSRHFDVRVVTYLHWGNVWRIALGTLWADLTYSWFAWDQAAWAVRFSRLLNRRSIVIIGGFDVVKMPEISYGNLTNPNNAARTKYAIAQASRPIAVSQSLKDDAERFTGRKDIKIVYHGFDAQEFTPGENKDAVALTVGTVNRSNMSRKGIDTFLKAARLNPEIQFRLVGRVERDIEKELKASASPNLVIVGRVDSYGLLKEMRRAAVYVQVSAHEGFGCSLAEAMLCECVPVVSRAGAIPEVVGDTGLYVPIGNAEATAKAVSEALKSKDGKAARKRISELFPIAKRERALVAAVNELMGDMAGGES